MKKEVLYTLLVFLLSSCISIKHRKKDQGYLISMEKEKSWIMPKPFGMVKIAGGSFLMGQSEEDISGEESPSSPMKTITMGDFFIDETEITNAQYRKFIFDTRDYLIREELAKKVEELRLEQEEGIGRYAYLIKEQEDGDEPDSIYEQYVKEKKEVEERKEDDLRKEINWEVPLIWEREDYPDIYYAQVIESFYLPLEGEEKRLDPKKILFPYKWKKEGVDNEKEEIEFIEIYPDSSRWEKDFPLSYNEWMAKEYFEHPSFNNHPVVNITWKQASAFAQWRSEYFRRKNKKNKHLSSIPEYRLPTEFEWEYAARGGIIGGSYPWKGDHLVDSKGCFLANFKPFKGNYLETKKGYIYTAKVKSFPANPYGLYDMAGNVSEWTSSSYALDSYNKIVSLNPQIKEKQKYLSEKKSVRGGSWKDIGYYLKVGVRDWEYQDRARSYIGFRTVQSIPPSAITKP